jgi:hypothetical protein
MKTYEEASLAKEEAKKLPELKGSAYGIKRTNDDGFGVYVILPEGVSQENLPKTILGVEVIYANYSGQIVAQGGVDE